MEPHGGDHAAGLPGASGENRYLDLERPSAARMYDYYLGGAANVATDRQAAEEVIKAIPETVHMARVNRSFLGRVVRYLAENGVDQFLDLGSGVPTVGNVHEIAQRFNPRARIAYVDIEPVAVTYARDLLGDRPGVTVTQEDIRDPGAVLAAPGVKGFLDLRRPVAVLAMMILHAMSDADDPQGLLAGYRDACAPGSYLGISHLCQLTIDTTQRRRTEEVYERTPTPLVLREKEQIAEFLAGYELVPPGLVLVPLWKPMEPTTEEEARRSNSYGALGRLPERPN